MRAFGIGAAGAATLALCGLTQAASAGEVLLGTVSGDLAIVYNCSQQGAACENPANISYSQTVASQTNSNGAPLQFDNTPLAILGGQSFNSIFSGQPVGSSQFGFDLVFGPGSAAAPKPTINAVDNVNGNP